MSTVFPSSLDTFSNPAATDPTKPGHAAHHSNANDAIAALEAKVGVDSSAVTTSLDYKVRNAVTAATIGNLIAGAAPKTTLVAADKIAFSNSEASNVLGEVPLSNLLDSLYLLGMPKNLSVCGIPFGILPGNGSNTGLQWTGTRGQFTLSAAILTNWWNIAQGFYAYFPANFGGQTIAAGLYWVQMTDDTHGEVFNNTYSNGNPVYQSSPTQFSNLTAGWLTQTTAEVTALTGITCKGNSLGPNGILRALWKQLCTNDANIKTIRLKIGGTTVLTAPPSSTYNDSDLEYVLQNAGVANKQINTRNNAGWIGYGGTTYSQDATSINTTADQNISWTMQLANNTDGMILVPRSITISRG